MRILCVCRVSVIHGVVGGMERISHEIASGLARRGVKVDFLTTAYHIDQREELRVSKDGVVYILSPATTPKMYGLEFNRYIQHHFELDHDYDLIYSVSGGASALVGNFHDVPVIATWHAAPITEDVRRVIEYAHRNHGRLNPYNIEDLLIGVLNKRAAQLTAMRGYTHHVAINDYVKKNLSALGLPDEDISVIRNGVLPIFPARRVLAKQDAREKFGLSSKTVIGVVGRNHPTKGHPLLREALGELDRDNIQIFLVGMEKEESPYRDLDMKTHSCSLAYDEMPQAYRAMDVFCNPTYLKNSDDTTIKEALSCGIKAIAPDGETYGSQHAWLAEKYGESVPLFLFRTGDKDSLKAALNRAIKRSHTQDFAAIDEYYDNENMVNQYHELFTSFA